MKLKIPEIEYLVEISESHITSMMFEDPSALARCFEYLRMSCEGQSDDAYLWDGSNTLSLAKSSEIIYYPSLINFNSRKIQTALVKKLQQLNSIEIDKANMLEDCIKALMNHFEIFMNDVDLDYNYKSFPDISSLMKFFDISIGSDDCNMCNRVKDYLHICSVLHLNEYIFCLNFKSIFSNDAIADIELSSLQNGINLVLLDHVSDISVSQYEKGIVLTKEYDIAEFYEGSDSILRYVFD